MTKTISKKTKTWWSNHHYGWYQRDKCKVYQQRENVHVNADTLHQSENVQNTFGSRSGRKMTLERSLVALSLVTTIDIFELF